MSVKDMTDQQFTRKLAELIYNARECSRDTDSRVVIIGDFGTYNTHPLTGDWKKAKWRATAEEAWTDIPNFSSDPAASLEVQAKALMTAGKEYTKCLTKILTDSFEIEVPENDPYWIATLVLTATPRQRAEASYMTLSSQD
ncbi:hypothetical protein [Paenibacillus polymyxa]|uniref:hypothetical protein n=1 Tax=Paenibacillus polymyxa TaxID=1406 RepID=UPI0025B69C0A|nr:hypothetical protein [Paenibacillus polymyxa]MDN4085945.1 hypothetical protein [Paenibacillus polymyxa]MDN4111847.1 hypothetical protein [Paenibacillus polymyxa]